MPFQQGFMVSSVLHQKTDNSLSLYALSPTWTDAEGLNFPNGTFSLKQIRAATDDFDPSNKIGEGGFGPVYKVLGKSYQLSRLEYLLRLSFLCHNHMKFLIEASVQGQLPDGTVIAVKQLSSKSRQGNREFLNEMGIISCLQHPNLVKLHGCCIESDQLLLVYEYMENNSLARALFGECSSYEMSDFI